MNNSSNNEKEKQENQNDIPSINIDNIENLNIEELEKLIEELEKNQDSNNKTKVIQIGTPLQMFKNNFVESIYKMFISFLLVFSFNVLFDIINTSFINFLIYFSIFFIIDFSFNFYIRKRFFALILYTFGLIHFIITCLSFIISGIICIQFIEIEFIKLSLCFIFMILYAISKKFILNYLLKMKNKFIQKKRGASKWCFMEIIH